jgi:hypothetical protein
VLVAALLLGACDNPYIQQFKQEFGWTEARMVNDGWLEGRRIPTGPVYCYETLAQADCYATAKERRDDQLINRQKETPVPDF